MSTVIHKTTKFASRHLHLLSLRRFTNDNLRPNNPVAHSVQPLHLNPTEHQVKVDLHEVERVAKLQLQKEDLDALKSASNKSVHHFSQDLSSTQLAQTHPHPADPTPKAPQAQTAKPAPVIDLTVPETERAIEKKKFSVKEFIKEEWHKLKASLRQLRADAFRLNIYYLTKQGTSDYTPIEYIEKEQIKFDLVKFIPYGIMIILPLGELLLLPYLALFPNAIPSQFYNEQSIGKMLKKNEDRQREAYDFLKNRLKPLFPQKYDRIAEIKLALKHDPFNAQLRQELARIDKEIVMDLMKNWRTYQHVLNFGMLTINEMDYVMKFMFFDYVDGVHIINVIMNLPQRLVNAICRYVFRMRWQLPIIRYTFDYFPLNEIRKLFLRLQLNRQYKRLAVEDWLSEQHPDSLAKMKSADLYNFARQRGIKVPDDRDRIKFYNDTWMTENRNIYNQELKFWVTLSRFGYGKFLV